MTVRSTLLAAFALCVAVVALVATPVLAQRAPSGAAAKYRQAAGQYVAGELGPAEAAARAGLRLDPSDAKLKALLDLITKDKEEDDGDQNQDQDGESGDDGQKNESGEGEDGAPQDGQSGDEGDPQDGQNGPEDENQAERDGTDQGQNESGQNEGAQPPQGGQRPGEGDATPQGQAPGAVGQMSRAQAERLLDAVGGDEKLLLREMQRFQTRGRRGDKDW